MHDRARPRERGRDATSASGHRSLRACADLYRQPDLYGRMARCVRVAAFVAAREFSPEIAADPKHEDHVTSPVGPILDMVSTESNDRIRMISARAAPRHERRRHEEAA